MIGLNQQAQTGKLRKAKLPGGGRRNHISDNPRPLICNRATVRQRRVRSRERIGQDNTFNIREGSGIVSGITDGRICRGLNDVSISSSAIVELERSVISTIRVKQNLLDHIPTSQQADRGIGRDSGDNLSIPCLDGKSKKKANSEE